MSKLEIKDLQVTVDTEDGPKQILKGVTLTINDGETHAIMGPNGSGKSTLAYSIAGHPKYTITGGTVTLDGEDVLAMTVDERARAGMFLAMQYPVEVPGVSVSNFLRTAKTAIDGEAPKLRTWVKDVNAALEQLNLDPTFGTRNVNEGFSGGEKKRHEIAQLELLNPKVAILDETDSGLDIDALQRRQRGRQPLPRPGGQGCPADHALHPHPALHHPRLRARLRRRPDRRAGRPRARRPARGRGLRQVHQGRVGLTDRPHPTTYDERRPAMSIPGLLPELEVIRKDFPILERVLAGGHPLVYLDSANTSQKPQVVIDTMVDHLERHNANVARAMHQLGAESSEAFEAARDRVAAFIKAPSRDEVIFTKNASEALNLVANTLAWRGDLQVGEGDEVVITEMEHHSNIVPWQLLTERTGATLRWFGLTDDGRLDLSNIDELITERTKVVSLTWVSNMLGTINPVREIADRAHQVGAIVVVDASQAAPQLPVDVVASGADVLVFTGHKVVGPTGIGVLWGRREVLDALPPFLGGGEMIETVRMERSTYAGIPHKFEAGTPPIVEAIGLGAAVDYLDHVGMEAIHAHEQAITAYALEGLQTVPGLTVMGPLDAASRGGAISFEIAGVHPHDVAQVLDSRGIAVRAGHHCAKPAHARFGVQSSTRMSSYLYTTPAEIDALVEGLHHTRSYFKLGD